MQDCKGVARSAALGIPIYGRPHTKEEPCWHIPKGAGEYLKWTWHPQLTGCWIRRSELPLFDDKKIVGA